MSVNEKQTFLLALNGGMVGQYFPTQLDDDVLEPLKGVLKDDLNAVFKATAVQPPTAAPPLGPAPSGSTGPAAGGGGRGGC